MKNFIENFNKLFTRESVLELQQTFIKRIGTSIFTRRVQVNGGYLYGRIMYQNGCYMLILR